MVNQKRIQNFISKFSFPRLFGTQDEKEAASKVKEELKSLGLPVITQKFEFSKFYSIYYGRIIFTLIFILLLILFLNINHFLFKILLNTTLILIVVVIIAVQLNLRLFYNYNSQNIYAALFPNDQRLSEGEGNDFKNICNILKENENKNIMFLAHMDSKGQRFNIVNRVRFFMLLGYSLSFTVIFIIFKNLLFPRYRVWLYLFGTIPLALNLVSLVLFFLNTTNNSSKGALDNASGVTCLLELVTYYQNNRQQLESLNNLNLWFIFTGAEECGTNGAKNLYQVIKGIKKKQFVFINIDSVGKHIDLIKFGMTSHYKCGLKTNFLKNAKKKGIEVPTRQVPVGVHTDGYLFFKKGYKGIEIGDWNCYEYLHSPKDTIDKIDAETLKSVCEIIITTLNDFNEDLNQLKINNKIFFKS